MTSDVGDKADESGSYELLRFSQSSQSQSSQSQSQMQSPLRDTSQSDFTTPDAIAATMKRNYKQYK